MRIKENPLRDDIEAVDMSDKRQCNAFRVGHRDGYDNGRLDERREIVVMLKKMQNNEFIKLNADWTFLGVVIERIERSEG